MEKKDLDIKQIYNKYKGQKAITNNVIGIICGYDAELDLLIMAVPHQCNSGWKEITKENIFINKEYSDWPSGYLYTFKIVEDIKIKYIA